ncbi:MAG: class I mannose-6-phosphate isomerase [Phycisphaerales bacterium]|jgi:mannose-6-phosphate isomerase|nr:class I mannose-6-phosphate isomerase [Phycisphaerales bacterium]MBT7171629.1 class I mannose-6-phosphate isomerase [Phycisphaerales bacterium]
MDLYPLKFQPLYQETIWGGRNLERLFDRDLSDGALVGESWELADLVDGVSVVDNGPQEYQPITRLIEMWGEALLGKAQATEDGRFPLLLKFLDANEVLSLQVHPDAAAVAKLGNGATLKTECWYIVESRDGYLYKGFDGDVTPDAFHDAIIEDRSEEFVKRYDCVEGDFHFLPAGTVHAVGEGVVVAEIQTPSNMTYRVSDWGRGREVHIQNSLQAIHFTPVTDTVPGAAGETLVACDYFTVVKRTAATGQRTETPAGQCVAIMLLSGSVDAVHAGEVESCVPLRAGETVLLPAGLSGAALVVGDEATWLEITLPEGKVL